MLQKTQLHSMKKNTRTFFPNVDYRIYICFGTLLLASFLLLSYQVTRHVDCDDAQFFVHADEYVINRVVEFQDNTDGAKSWEWDFGDSTAVDNRKITFHKYQKPGDYIVTLKINGNCVHEKTLTITSISQEKGYLPMILSPNVVTVGENVQFGAEKEGGESWEWSFGETSNTDASVSYTHLTLPTSDLV